MDSISTCVYSHHYVVYICFAVITLTFAHPLYSFALHDASSSALYPVSTIPDRHAQIALLSPAVFPRRLALLFFAIEHVCRRFHGAWNLIVVRHGLRTCWMIVWTFAFFRERSCTGTISCEKATASSPGWSQPKFIRVRLIH